MLMVEQELWVIRVTGTACIPVQPHSGVTGAVAGPMGSASAAASAGGVAWGAQVSTIAAQSQKCWLHSRTADDWCWLTQLYNC